MVAHILLLLPNSNLYCHYYPYSHGRAQPPRRRRRSSSSSSSSSFSPRPFSLLSSPIHTVLTLLVVTHVLFNAHLVTHAIPVIRPIVAHHYPPLSPSSSSSSNNNSKNDLGLLDDNYYHHTDHLLALIRRISAKCPHADAEWTVVTSAASGRWRFPLFANLPLSKYTSGNTRLQENKVLTITLTHNAKARNAARRAGGIVSHRRAIVSTFGEHGRERITSELALRILQRLCPTSSSTSPPLTTSTAIDKDIDKLLRSNELVMVPIVNEQGRRAVEAGHDCWRLNARGVDLNRNYKRGWGLYDNTTIRAEERCGHAPLSEYEARAVDALVRRFETRAYISVHSGDVAVLPPWDGHGEERMIDPWVHTAARAIADTHCGSGCMVARASHAFGYKAYGTGVDHMLAERHVPLTLTVEVYGGDERLCKTMFNPESKEKFDEVMRNWSALLETVAKVVGDKEGVASGGHRDEDEGTFELMSRRDMSLSSTFDALQQNRQGEQMNKRQSISHEDALLKNDRVRVPNTWADDGYEVHWESDDDGQPSDRQREQMAGRPQMQANEMMTQRNENGNIGAAVGHHQHGGGDMESQLGHLQKGLAAMTLFAVAVPVAQALRQTFLGEQLIETTKRWLAQTQQVLATPTAISTSATQPSAPRRGTNRLEQEKTDGEDKLALSRTLSSLSLTALNGSTGREAVDGEVRRSKRQL